MNVAIGIRSRIKLGDVADIGDCDGSNFGYCAGDREEADGPDERFSIWISSGFGDLGGGDTTVFVARRGETRGSELDFCRTGTTRVGSDGGVLLGTAGANGGNRGIFVPIFSTINYFLFGGHFRGVAVL